MSHSGSPTFSFVVLLKKVEKYIFKKYMPWRRGLGSGIVSACH
jgi:hypothetical protein